MKLMISQIIRKIYDDSSKPPNPYSTHLSSSIKKVQFFACKFVPKIGPPIIQLSSLSYASPPFLPIAVTLNL